MEHRSREEKQGGIEIWPATAKITGQMRTDKLDEEQAFCSQLEAESCLARPELVW